MKVEHDLPVEPLIVVLDDSGLSVYGLATLFGRKVIALLA